MLAGLTAADLALVEYCREAMRRGSLSFYLASRLAGQRLQTALLLLYAWCRYCDDVVDEADQSAGVAPRLAALDSLRQRTAAALSGESQGTKLPPNTAGGDPGEQIFAAFALLAKHYRIPLYYPNELLAGMEMDITGYRYQTLADLRLYAYRVASTVGLMFSHLAGLDEPGALRHAADLGAAMQLTNIARDVTTDAALGRVYLPEAWLAAAGVPRAEVALPQHREAVALVVKRLLDEAQALYLSAEAGLAHLPFNAALAAATARFIYAEIGYKVGRLGARAWDQRVVVPLWRKLVLVCKGLALACRTLPKRQRTPWRPVPLDLLWRRP